MREAEKHDKRAAALFAEQNRPKTVITVYKPTCTDDVQPIIDKIKAHEIVVINYEGIQPTIAHSVHNSLLGALYAISGSLFEISEYVYIYALL